MTTTYTDQEILDAIRACIHGTANRKAKQISIAGRSLSSFSFDELIKAEQYFANRVAATAGQGQAVVAKFRKPS